MKPKKIAKNYGRYGQLVSSSKASNTHTPRNKRKGFSTPTKSVKHEGRVYFAFVVKNISGDWRYVGIRDNMLCTTNDIDYASCFTQIDESMRELWKRVAIDDAIEWDEAVDAVSFRLVKLNIGFEDATSHVFHDYGDQSENMKYALLNCLTPKEAQLLGLEREYAKAKLFTNPDASDDDHNLLSYLKDTSLKGDTGNLLHQVLD